MKAAFLQRLSYMAGWDGDARMYLLDEELTYTSYRTFEEGIELQTRYVAVQTRAMFGVVDATVFACDASGAADFTARIYSGKVETHKDALYMAGIEL